jgi:hypothetical protein
LFCYFESGGNEVLEGQNPERAKPHIFYSPPCGTFPQPLYPVYFSSLNSMLFLDSKSHPFVINRNTPENPIFGL